MVAKKSAEKIFELRYNGWLANESSSIYLHYGTENWSKISECKMRKLKNCYKTEITVPASVASISFCFRDTDGKWDNNNGNDYWYTPTIGETYSCVEVTPIIKEDKKVVAPTVATRKTATRTCASKKTIKKD